MSAVKVGLSNKRNIDRMDQGLVSVNGAQQVIQLIKSRPTATISKLILGHNELSDEGCITLFQFLDSVHGHNFPTSEISLNANQIGDRGLLAIASYLENNSTLRELFLQNNEFNGDPSVILPFARAINSSQLELLSLTTNRSLSDPFAEALFPNLRCPSLREVHLSVVGFTRHAAKHIARFVSSRHCHLHTLKLNGNFLGLRGVRRIICAVEKHNFSLTTLEVYSNYMADDDASGSEDSDTDIGTLGLNFNWKDGETLLRRLLIRNAVLKKDTARQAFQLLKYSRIMLPSSPLRDTQSATVPSSSLFHSLPVELQQATLSLLSPTLSPAQRIRIFHYAASVNTLCPNNAQGQNLYMNCSSPASCRVGHIAACAVVQGGQKWLDSMGCSFYDPDGS